LKNKTNEKQSKKDKNKKLDWICNQCKYENFGHRTICLKCKTVKIENEQVESKESFSKSDIENFTTNSFFYPFQLRKNGKETDPSRLRQRLKQVIIGKSTAEYHNYINNVPMDKRNPSHMITPDKEQICSKRSWDGQVRKWRRYLHNWDPKPGEVVETNFEMLQMLQDEIEELNNAMMEKLTIPSEMNSDGGLIVIEEDEEKVEQQEQKVQDMKQPAKTIPDIYEHSKKSQGTLFIPLLFN